MKAYTFQPRDMKTMHHRKLHSVGIGEWVLLLLFFCKKKKKKLKKESDNNSLPQCH